MAYEYHTKRRQLTSEEMTLARRELVEALIEADKIAVEKSIADREFKKRMTPFQKTAKELMAKVRSGLDEGSANCRVVVDSVTRTVKFFVEKKVWDEETQTRRTEDTLFDEQTFEQVGEKQLTMWQEETESDAIDDAYERLSVFDHDTTISDELESVYANSKQSPDFYDLFVILCNPWPSAAADLWLKHVESPSTNIQLAFTNRPLEEALTSFAAGLTLLLDGGVLEEFDRILFEEGVDPDVFDIAPVSLTIANTLALVEEIKDADDGPDSVEEEAVLEKNDL